jgi:hypothetical protein
VMWWLSIGGKIHSKGLATSEWGGRTNNSYGTRLVREKWKVTLRGEEGLSDSRR